MERNDNSKQKLRAQEAGSGSNLGQAGKKWIFEEPRLFKSLDLHSTT